MNESSNPPRRPDGRVIAIRGAREHNLKNVDLDIPRDQLVVITGLSGSGKSSLAFDTIYAEGQRRYVESLSAYARQFLEMMQKPDVDQIDGLSPAISIEQKTTSKNPRSTVGTVTEIYDYMRLLWARVGVPYSPATGLPIESQTVSQMVDRILALPEGTRLYLLAPIVRGRKGEYRKELAELQKHGFQRVKVDGAFYEIADAPALDKKLKHDIDVVVDRIVVRADIGHAPRRQLRDRAEAGRRPRRRRIRRHSRLRARRGDARRPGRQAGRSEGARTHHAQRQRLLFSEKFACPVSGFTIPEIEPRLFSFNNPLRRLPDLRRPRRRADDRRRPGRARQGRDPARRRHRALGALVLALLPADAGGARQALRLHARRQWRDLPKKAQHAILYGTGDDEIRFAYDDGLRAYETTKPFEGVIRNLERRWTETDSAWAREEIAEYFSRDPLRGLRRQPPEARGAGGEDRRPAHRRGRGAVDQARGRLVRRAAGTLTAKQNEIAARILKEIRDRLQVPDRCRPRLSDARRAPPARCRAARASASASPRRSARA